MSFFVNAFRDLVSKDKDFANRKEAVPDILYSTGFPNLDATNGYIADALDPETKQKYQYYNMGICDGSINLIIARSGSGKSTYCGQAGANIVRPFENGSIFEENIEGGMTTQRRMALCRFSQEEVEKRIIVRNSGITIENFYKRVKAIHDLKIQHAEELTYDTGLHDIYGNPIKKMIPTVVILDSLATISPEKVGDEKELSGQMTQTAAAKAVAASLRALVPACKEANIIIFIINHITQKVEINPMMHSKAQTVYLKNDETLPRGVTPIYLANNVIRLDDAVKLKEEEGFGIAGTITSFILVKSRSARANSMTKLVFNQDIGFDPELSMYQFLKDHGYVNGAGVGYYLGNHSEYKFSQKKFKEKLATDAGFRQVFEEISQEALAKIMDKPRVYSMVEDENQPIDTIVNMMKRKVMEDTSAITIKNAA